MKMEDRRIQQIKYIANKEPTYNKDINQHIESCRISMKIINKKENTISILRNMLEKRDETIRNLEENNKELRDVITEQYKIIGELLNKNN